MTLRDELLAAHDGDPLRAAVATARDLERGDRESIKIGYTRANAVLAVLDLFPEVDADELTDELAKGTRTFRVRILVEELPENTVEGVSTTLSAVSFRTVSDARLAGDAAASALRRHVMVVAANAETERTRSQR